MQQTITAKIQILVNPSDKQMLCDTMKAYSDACNYVSDYIYKTHNLSRYNIQEDTYYLVREIYGLRSQMAVSCVRTVIAKYKTPEKAQKAMEMLRDASTGVLALNANVPDDLGEQLKELRTVIARDTNGSIIEHNGYFQFPQDEDVEM